MLRFALVVVDLLLVAGSAFQRFERNKRANVGTLGIDRCHSRPMRLVRLVRVVARRLSLARAIDRVVGARAQSIKVRISAEYAEFAVQRSDKKIDLRTRTDNHVRCNTVATFAELALQRLDFLFDQRIETHRIALCALANHTDDDANVGVVVAHVRLHRKAQLR